MSILKRLWLLIEEPRVRRVFWACLYASMVVAGTGTFLAPPTSIESVIGPYLTAVWATLLAVGGMMGAW